MDYRRNPLAQRQNQNQANSSHVHSLIYASFAGTGGHARYTNGVLTDDNEMMWWDDAKIEATVTRPYVTSQLRPDEATRLDEHLRFGHGLTDDTYWEWIELKAKRIFLILVELGVPDQIFGVIDDSWDDDDLPIPMDQIERLALTLNKDERLERKFFQKQFNYLLRHIQKGDQLVYDEEEVVPLELAEKRQVGAVVALMTRSNMDKVHLPGKPDEVYLRHRLPLGTDRSQLSPEEYLSGIETMKTIEHEHLTSLWASYIHEGAAYILITPVQDTNLKSILTITPQSIKILAKQDRRHLLLNWIHCLAEALAALHHQGLAHRNIKPATIMLDIDNRIFLSDVGIFPLEEKSGFEKDGYDYMAPEQAPRHVISTPGITIASYFTSSTGSHSSGSHSSGSPPAQHASTSHRHDPQKGDIFSLGAIFLEILTFLMKRSTKNFANHRSAKNKTPGRGGGLPDSSFHKNLGQIESWMDTLAKESSKKEDKIYRGIPYIMSLIVEMLNANPSERPSAEHTQQRLYTILNDHCGIGADPEGLGSGIHCETPKVKDSEWNFGFEELRLASQRAAAEACAAVAVQHPEPRPMPQVNGGVVVGVDRGERRMPPIAQARSVEAYADAVPRSSHSSGEGRVRATGRPKPKAKPWQAPVYSGLYLSHI
ncbi:kinase-like domain-containing protein [Calycina marina]|uniref:Kinase-like domain-containing protein n=1 Tax=Calycina marina TaxID=1763456 RepID=A0A9P8CJL8_9HELO|nr:kinase-like domain-containing protein [Calycina marina]